MNCVTFLQLQDRERIFLKNIIPPKKRDYSLTKKHHLKKLSIKFGEPDCGYKEDF